MSARRERLLCILQGPEGREPLLADVRCHCGVGTISRLLKSIGFFFKRALTKRLSEKETYAFKEFTNRSQPIGRFG